MQTDGRGVSVPKFAVQHYTAAEIASAWKLSEDTIRKLFRDEPGVLVIGNQKPRYGRRRYCRFGYPNSWSNASTAGCQYPEIDRH